jgi:hypothetical protein
MTVRTAGAAISAMRWSVFFLRWSAVQSFVARSPLVVSFPFGSSSITSQSARNRHPLRPAFSLLRLADRVAVAEANNATETTKDAAAAGTRKNERGTVILADADEFIKPERDLRDYRVIKLENNLEALLVSTTNASSDEDDSAKVEAASMHIQAGHFDDTIPGLAHFYEHMLVRGELSSTRTSYDYRCFLDLTLLPCEHVYVLLVFGDRKVSRRG